VVYHQCFMEQMDTVAAFDLIFSNSVLEHVEDVNTFFGRCLRSLKPGSRMIHCIDWAVTARSRIRCRRWSSRSIRTGSFG